MPPWLSLTNVPLVSTDSTQWMVSGTPPMNAIGIDTVILTVTSDDPNDTLVIRPRNFIFPMHVNMTNSPPALTSTFPATVNASTGQTISQTITAADPDLTRGRRDTLWIDYYFVDPVGDTVVETSTTPTFTDNGDGTASFSWVPAAGDVGSYKLVVVTWDYSFEVDSSVTDVTIALGFDDLIKTPPTVQAIPNPFSERSEITFFIPFNTEVAFDVTSTTGELIDVIASRHYAAGKHHVVWDASALPPGVYMLRMKAGTHILSSRMVITR
jgi:hypothetical protein